MSISEALSRLDALQRSRRFKIIASVALLAVAVLAGAAVIILSTAPDTAGQVAGAADEAARAQQALDEAQRAARGGSLESVKAVGRANPITLGLLAVGALTGVALLTVWLGLALTYLGLALLGAVIAGPLLAFKGTRSLGEIVAGAVILAGSFAAVSEGIRLALSRPGPLLAVARNVLAEAVRVKLSLIFIVLLVFFLAGLPYFLDADQPLRYRVQLFLQYGTAGTFWTIALLTVFFAISTVAFEQRDKVIWQTMTKPVPPWKYLVGKWLGVTALNTSLLVVSAAGVFLFTQRLRLEPAQGEVRAYVNASGSPSPTDDRRILESQVLAARRVVRMDPPKIDMPLLEKQVDEQWQTSRVVSSELRQSARRAIREKMLEETMLQARTVEAGSSRDYEFRGLGSVRNSTLPLSIRFKINSGSDNPSNLLRVTFVIAGRYVAQREVVLNTAQVFDIPDDLVPLDAEGRERALRDVRASCIDENGVLAIQVWNGDPIRGIGNPRAISFPPDGLEVLYTAGTYEGNYLRVAAALWLKLAFIAAVAVACATFLSFPVACLVTMGLLFVAESSGFLAEALQSYEAVTDAGKDYFRIAVRIVALPVSFATSWYAQMRPAADLADGRLVSWEALGTAAVYLLAAAAVTLAAGSMIFRRRELATYSGK